LAGGWGNAGGGITYFVMPVVFDSLVHHHGLTPHRAWRVAFIVPFIFITATAIGMLTLCDDTPVGKWSDRYLAVPGATVVDESGLITDKPANTHESPTVSDEKLGIQKQQPSDEETQVPEVEKITCARGEIIKTPSLSEALPVIFSLQTLTLMATYFCSFGGELALNSVLGAYYLKNFPKLGQTLSGRWASMYGLLNVITRPSGGFVGDLIYKYTQSLWLKKMWIHFVGISTGLFLIAIGLKDPHHQPTMFGLIAGMAFFHEAGNGANFALVPHVHPFANGILSGLTGAAGNLGGVVFAIIFRYNGTDYARAIWICGILHIALNVAVIWIKPIPKGQIGGR
jgi:NNP family nitrate/nitrite transporter-like MFS transporter